MSEASSGETIVYVGTYTSGESEGIHVYRMNASTGALELVDTAAGPQNPSFLALHPGRRRLYAVNEVKEFAGEPGGAVSGFAIDSATGALSPLGRRASPGEGPCQLTVDRTGRFLLVANYAGGSLSVLPLDEEGRVGECAHFVQHEGSSVNPNRQAGPHVHSVTMDPTNQYALVADLGLDRVMVYSFDHLGGELTPHDPPWIETAAGAGPRHVAFHPAGERVYLINELDSTLDVFAWEGARGWLRRRQTVSALPEGFAGTSHGADVHVAPSGRHLYASNRGHDSIAIFEIDQATGELSLVGHEPTRGATPRNFALSPGGDFLLAANRGSDSVVTFRVNAETGGLEPTEHTAEVPAPACLKILQLAP